MKSACKDNAIRNIQPTIRILRAWTWHVEPHNMITTDDQKSYKIIRRTDATTKQNCCYAGCEMYQYIARQMRGYGILQRVDWYVFCL